MKDIDADINAKIASAKNILIVSHVRPDGDAIGALLGLGLALQQAGKTVQMVLNDGLPASFRHLPGNKQVKKEPGHHKYGSFTDISANCQQYGN